MGSLMLINPRKRSKAKRASPKRRAKRRTSHRRAAPVMANPIRRRRARLSHVRKNPSRRKYRRNPIGGRKISLGGISAMAKTAAVGAAGALVVDLGFGYLGGMLPASMQTPVDAAGALNPMYFVAKGALAVALGVFGAKLTKNAPQMAEGSLTISAYQIMRSFVPASLNLGYVSPGRPVGRPRQGQVGSYVSGGDSGMGGYTPPVNRQKYMGSYVS